MSKQIEALKLALEALSPWAGEDANHTEQYAAYHAIREALASKANEQQSGIKQVVDLYDSPEQPAQQQEPVAYDKTEINCFAQDLYDQKMREGKRGHYESMFHVIHQCIKKVASQPSQSRSDVKPLTDEQRRETISNAWNEYLRGEGHDSFGWYLSQAIEAAHGIMSVPDGKGDA